MRKLLLTTIALLALLPASAQALTTPAKMGTKAEEVAGMGSSWTNVGNLTMPAKEATSGPRSSPESTKPVLVSGFGLSVPSNATVSKVRATFFASESSLTETMFTLEAVNGPSVLGKTTSGRYQLCSPPVGCSLAEEWNITATAAEVDSPAFGIKLKAQDNGPPSTFGLAELHVELSYTVPKPMFYKNRALIASTIKALAWGAPTLTSSSGSFTCPTVAIATVHNEPTGVGGLAAWESAYCEAPTCEAKAQQGFVKSTGEVNWAMMAPEALEPSVQVNGIGLEAGCKGGASQAFSGALTASYEQPLAQGSGPAKLVFGAGSGELSGGAKVTGKLNVMGFETGEMIGLK